MGLRDRQSRNETSRANGNEPKPGGGGVKRWMRYHARTVAEPVKIKNPEKYMHSFARAWSAVRLVHS